MTVPTSLWTTLLLAVISAAHSESLSPTIRTGTLTIPLIPHHVQRARRGLTDGRDLADGAPRRRQEAEQVGALYHGYGTHYIDLWCGTPPQRQTVIVDTGSGVTAFPCSGCADCGSPAYHIDGYFRYSESSTFEQVGCDQCSARGRCTSDNQCRIGMSYQEGSSWNAFEAKDTCYVGGFHNAPVTQVVGGEDDIDPRHASTFGFPLQFGCQTKITGLFKTQLADGIMGMENAESSFWAQMHAANKIQNKAFSLCFSRPEATDRDGTEAGAMTLGGTDRRLHKSPMVYASASQGGFFSIHVRAVYLRHGMGGESAQTMDEAAALVNLNQPEEKLNAGGVIVDSGTTDTYWNSHIQSALRDVFKEMSGRPFNHDKLKLSPTDLAELPTILFQISGDEAANRQVAADNGGDPNKIVGLAGDMDPNHPFDVILAVPASHYMEGDNGVYVNRFYDTESSGNVIGANSMMGHEILFDADNGRIGWAESSCDYTKLITENGYMDVLSLNPPVSTAEETTTEVETPAGAEKIIEGKDEGVGQKEGANEEETEKAQTEQVETLGGDVVEKQATTKEETPAGEEKTIEGKDEAVGPEEGADEQETEKAEAEQVETSGGDVVEKEPEYPPPHDKGAISDEDRTEGITPEQEKKEKLGEPVDAPDERPIGNDEKQTNVPASGEDAVDQGIPSNNSQQTLVGNCNGHICRGGLIVSLVLSCLFCFCFCRCCCEPRKVTPVVYQGITEVEMANGTGKGKGYPTYTDDFVNEDGDDDAEHGEKSCYKDV